LPIGATVEKNAQTESTFYSVDLQKGKSFSNKLVEKKIRQKYIVFKSRENQFFVISSAFRSRRRDQFWHFFVTQMYFFCERVASRKLLYLPGFLTIVEGPGVPETAKGRKKALAEFSVFSVPQKRRRDTILTILGATLKLIFASFFVKKHVFFQVWFFFNFVIFLGRCRRRGGGPSCLKILQISSQFHHAVNP